MAHRDTEIVIGSDQANPTLLTAHDIRVYGKHCYDGPSGAFCEMRRLDTGKRLHFSETRFFQPRTKGN